MSTLWQPGQLLFAGFEGHDIPRDLARLIEQGRVGGVALFARNLRDAEQVRGLVRSLRLLAPEDAPLTVCLDQEGGRVQRLRTPWTEWPSMRRLGARQDESTIERVAQAMARELLDVGVTLNFAPCVDVDDGPERAIIGDRSFSGDPEQVRPLAVAFVRAMQAAKVACCAKHFPGHGGTVIDSHRELPRLRHDLETLRRLAFPPFRAVIEADVAAIMTAHILFPRLDAKRPATVSPDVLAILREEMGFQSLIITDDLEMRAVADRFSPADLTRSAIGAGADVVLACRRPDVQAEALRALEHERDSVVESALTRLVAFKRKYAAAPIDADAGPPYPEHQALAKACATEAAASGHDPTVFR